MVMVPLPTTGLLAKFLDDADFLDANLLFATILFTDAFANDSYDNNLVDMLRLVSDLSLSILLFFPVTTASLSRDCAACPFCPCPCQR